MSPRLRIGAWLVIQLALIAGWGFALHAGHVGWSLIPLGLFALRRMPQW